LASNVTYTYDTSTSSSTKGLLLSISMPGPLPPYLETLNYDSLNRLSSRTMTMDGQTYTIGYGYNQAAQKIQLTYPSTRVVATNHDPNGMLSSVTEPTNPSTGAGGTYLSNVAYNVAGQVTGDTVSTWTTESFGYDSQRMQLTSQTATASGGQTGGLMNLNYSYQAAAGQLGANTTAGNAGQLIAINNSTVNGVAESGAYTYDLQGRLVTSSQATNGTTPQRRFAYDRWGNRTGMWDAISGGNQIQSVTLQQSGGAPTNQIQSVTAGSTANYTYDAAGNVTNDGVHSYQYDAENRIKSVDSAATGSYRYDYQNRRIKRSTSSGAIHYIWDGVHVLAEHNMNNGSHIVDYVYAGDRLLAEGAGSQLGVNGSFTFLISDRLSVRLSLGRVSGVLGQQAHLPFGEELGESGIQEKHHFTTYEADNETGTDYAINRQYAVGTGRFMSVDPMLSPAFRKGNTSGCSAGKSSAGSNPAGSNPQGLNPFSYMSADPINSTDPAGLFMLSTCLLGLASLLGFDLDFLTGVETFDPAFLSQFCVTININIPALLASLIASLEAAGGPSEKCKHCQNRQDKICTLKAVLCDTLAEADYETCASACDPLKNTIGFGDCIKHCSEAKRLHLGACKLAQGICQLEIRDKCPQC
jgi:RHS repeat-associated protein